MLLLGAADAQAVECRSESPGGLALTVCRVDLAQERLRIYHKDSKGQPFGDFASLRQALQAQHGELLFAMNAGMYEPDRSSVGLLVQDGRTRKALNLREGAGNFYQQPNGVLMWTRRRARVLSAQEYAQQQPKPAFATQSGPMLVHEGQITGSAVMNPQSKSRKIRNGVCAPEPSKLVFAISEQPVTFFEFAGVFKDAFQCSEALYLDGTVSSLYYPPLQRDDNRDRLGPIVGIARVAR